LLAEAHGPSSGAAKRQSIKDIALVMTPEGPVVTARAQEGKPNLSGLWEIDQTPYSELRSVLPAELLDQQAQTAQQKGRQIGGGDGGLRSR
jgi:hypothetical protein